MTDGIIGHLSISINVGMSGKLFRTIFFALFAAAGCTSEPTAGGTCTTSRDCLQTEICLGGTCTPKNTGGGSGCTTDLDCELGRYCNVPTGQCLDGAAPQDAGSLGEDAQAPAPDAGNNQETDASTNGPADATPTDAGTSNQCLTDQECGPPGQICVNNQCVNGCGIDSTLCNPATEVCDTNTGRCVQVSCAGDQDCNPPSTICESAQCIPGCHLAGGLQCSGMTPQCNANTGRCEAAAPCSLDSDCNDANKICVSQSCVTKCNLPGGITCVSPEVCNPQSGRCVQGGAMLGQSCSLDSQCAPDFCMGLVDSTTMMTTRFCSKTCGAGSDCPVGFRCGYVSGTKMCIPGSYFNPPLNFALRAGQMCDINNVDCQSGWYTSNPMDPNACTCLETCSRSLDCNQFGGNCETVTVPNSTPARFDSICGTAAGAAANTSCVVNSDCASGICNRYTNQCAAPCCADTDCAGNTICTVYDFDVASAHLVKVCRTPQTGMAGTGASGLGASCTIESDCSSGACIPVDPSMPTGARKCSTTCCKDSDCSAIPGGGKCRPLNGPTVNNISTIVGYCVPN